MQSFPIAHSPLCFRTPFKKNAVRHHPGKNCSTFSHRPLTNISNNTFGHCNFGGRKYGGIKFEGNFQTVVECTAAGSVPMPEGETQGFGEGLMNGWASLRAFLFYTWTLTIAVPLFALMVIMWPIVLLVDKYRRSAEHFINNFWAKMSSFFFYRVEIEGRENLPANTQPAVYVANHQSYLDIFTLFHLNRSFKFISKTSNFLIPIVGWSMFLTGHVMLNRVDRRSQLKCLQQCQKLLSQGASVLFFPEGTRSDDKKLSDFKKGAFSVAVKAGVPVVPISLMGTGDLMPNGKESRLYPGRIFVKVHPVIETRGVDAQVVCDDARKVIASGLPPELVN